MKKLMSLILASAMALSLVACGSNSTASSASAASTPASSNTAETPDAPASNYPNHAIELHTHKSGSTVEINTRIFAPFLSKYLNGTNVLVVNDDTMETAFQTTVNADPDGYVISSTTCNVQLRDATGGLTFDTVDDVRFVGTFTVGGGYFVAVTKDFAAKHNIATFDDLIALTQAEPDQYTISTSIGAISELATYSIIEDCKMPAYPVDLADSNTRLTAFLKGDLDIFVGNWSTIQQYVETGDVLCLCFYGDERSPFVPDYPCTKELGYSVLPADNYYYISCPKDTPDDIFNVLCAAVEAAANDPEYVEAIEGNAARACFKNSEETYEMLKSMREVLKQFA